MQEDTGSSCTIISTTMWKDLGKPTLTKYKGPTLKSYDGSALKIIGVLETAISYDKKYGVHEIRVVDSSKRFGLIGRDMLEASVHHVSDEENKKMYPDQELGTIKNVNAKLQVVHGTKPIFHSAREVPLPLQEQVDNEIDRMVKMGVLVEIKKGGTEWASPIVVSRKPNGTIRLCCDYKVTINKYLLNDSYHQPDMGTIFSRLDGAKRFAKFDLKSAYWQVQLDEASMPLTTINTKKGLYQFTRLPFGVKTASSIFQRIMEQICHGMEGIIVYQDDVLVHAANRDQLKERSSKLLAKLNKRNKDDKSCP